MRKPSSLPPPYPAVTCRCRSLLGISIWLHCILDGQNGLHRSNLPSQLCRGGRGVGEGGFTASVTCQGIFMSVLSEDDKSSAHYIGWGHTAPRCIFTHPHKDNTYFYFTDHRWPSVSRRVIYRPESIVCCCLHGHVLHVQHLHCVKSYYIMCM